jgi:phosphate-selective porin
MMMTRITLLAATLALTAATAATARADVNIPDDDAKLTVDCAKHKAVNIAGDRANITLVGTCLEVNIAGSKATVRGSVHRVSVSGDHNTFVLDTVDQILISGDHNSISYKRSGKGAKPALADTGESNQVNQAK